MNHYALLVALAPLFVNILGAATPLADTSNPTEHSTKRRQWIGEPASMCATELLCCNAVTKADDAATSALLSLLGVNIAPTYTVGVTCSPISPIGSFSSCSAQPVCCWWGAQYAYLVAIDCTPVTLGE